MKTITLNKIIIVRALNRIYLLILVSISLAAMISSCHEKPSGNDLSPCEANPGNCKSVLEAKDFFLFKLGSFWVYEEETSHERDSMYVIEFNNTEGYDFDVVIKSSLTDYQYHFWPTYYGNISGCHETGPVNKRCLFVNRSKFKFQDHLGEAIVFFINNNVGESISTGSDLNYCPNNHLTFSAKYDSLQISNTYFHHIIRIDQECEFAEGKQPTKYYYSRNIGIVRKELIDSNQIWNLVNYHVIQ